jgi:polyisoprenoid-binding protein YceI
MLRHPFLTLLSAVLFACVSGVVALADDFTIRPGEDKNQVVFTSKATLESFQGKTRQVSGNLTFDPANLGDSITVRVEVDLASLDTGISMRNKHMRENHLETAKYPKAVYEGGRILETSGHTLNPGDTVHLRLGGRFNLHGVSKPIEVPIDVTRAADGTLHVSTHFDVALADYKINRPTFLIMKLEETQHVTVQVTAHPNS